MFPVEELRYKPDGKAPSNNVQLTKLAASASAESVTEYHVLTFPLESVASVRIENTGLIVRDNVRSTLRPSAEDTALTVKEYVPDFVGVPESVPDVLRARPGGRVPAV